MYMLSISCCPCKCAWKHLLLKLSLHIWALWWPSLAQQSGEGSLWQVVSPVTCPIKHLFIMCSTKLWLYILSSELHYNISQNAADNGAGGKWQGLQWWDCVRECFVSKAKGITICPRSHRLEFHTSFNLVFYKQLVFRILYQCSSMCWYWWYRCWDPSCWLLTVVPCTDAVLWSSIVLCSPPQCSGEGSWGQTHIRLVLVSPGRWAMLFHFHQIGNEQPIRMNFVQCLIGWFCNTVSAELFIVCTFSTHIQYLPVVLLLVQSQMTHIQRRN